MTYENLILEATDDILDNFVGTLFVPSVVSEDVINACNNEIIMENTTRVHTGFTKYKQLTTLTTVQVARILLKLEEVKQIDTGTDVHNNDKLLLGVYQKSGDDRGTYITGNTDLRRLARNYKPSMTTKEFNEVCSMLHDTAPIVKRCEEKNLVAVNNGIFHYDTKVLESFTPDLVFLTKIPVDYNHAAQNIVIHNPIDGTDWDIESWMIDMFDNDTEVSECCWESIGACIRPLQGYVLRATGYEKGMESRVASVKALEQMGFKKTKESEYGIVQLHERFKEIIEEEMINDALEYGYEAIQRTPDSGEHRKRSDVSEFREMAAERQDLKELQMEVNDAVADNQLREFALEQRENSVKRQKALNDEKSKEINDRDEQVRKKEMAFSEKNSELILRESNVLIKESEIDEREEKLKKKQEQDEKDFQMKEDKMEAQQRVISQREKSVSERENSVDVKENEVAQKSAEYGKKLVLLDSLIDDVQSYKSPVSVAKNVLEILKESMNEVYH